MTRCKQFYRKMKELRKFWYDGNKQMVFQFCQKESKAIYHIYDHIDYMDSNFPDWLDESTIVDNEAESCNLEQNTPLAEGATRELRALENQDPVLHEQVVNGVREKIKEKGELKTTEVKKIIEEKKVQNFPRIEPTDNIVCDSIENILAYLEKESVDLILTDPPYPAEHLPLWELLAKKAKYLLKPDGYLVAYSGQYHLPEVIDYLSRHLEYIWTFAIILKGSVNHVQAVNIENTWKPILVFGTKFHAVPHMTDIVESPGREKDGHEWQQSLEPIKELIRRFTVEGHMVVDPFLGSGTTALAAKELNRKFFGMDIDDSAVQTTLRRLENGKT